MVLIDATCKESGVGQAMKLFNEMRRKGCKPDVVSSIASCFRFGEGNGKKSFAENLVWSAFFLRF